MALPVSTPEEDHVGKSGELLKDLFDGALNEIASRLDLAVKTISNNPNHTASEFWSRQGSNGAAILTEFAYWRSVLQSKAPDKITDAVAAAGSTLVVNPDGTVTVPE
tara:strand:+ start:519 stop:839 length:321 start_codon:yes stop_codon:yes gene_type:complete